MNKLVTLFALVLISATAGAHNFDCHRIVNRKNAELQEIENQEIFFMNQATAALKQPSVNFACVQKDLLRSIDYNEQYSDKDAELLALLEEECDLTEYTALKNRVEGRVNSGDEAMNTILRQNLTYVVNQAISRGQSCD